MVEIVVISGKQGSGKTTLAKNLQAKVHERMVETSAICMSFADPIYHMHNLCRDYMKSLGVWLPHPVKDGRLLQLLGTEWGRQTIGPNVWVDAMKGNIARAKALVQHGDSKRRLVVLIPDCRFRNEFDAFSSTALTIRLEAPAEVRKERAEMWRDHEDHPSEIDLDGYSKDGKFNLKFFSDVTSASEIAETAFGFLRTRMFL